ALVADMAHREATLRDHLLKRDALPAISKVFARRGYGSTIIIGQRVIIVFDHASSVLDAGPQDPTAHPRTPASNAEKITHPSQKTPPKTPPAPLTLPPTATVSIAAGPDM